MFTPWSDRAGAFFAMTLCHLVEVKVGILSRTSEETHKNQISEEEELRHEKQVALEFWVVLPERYITSITKKL